MVDKTSEQLSALVDDECSELEIELAIRRLTKDRELKTRWQCYHLISDALKNNVPEAIDIDFHERIREAIEADSALPKQLPSSKTPWLKPITGLALAASVAVVALFGLNFMQPGQTGKPAYIASTTTPQSSPQPPPPDQDRNSKLNDYVVNHSYAATNGVNGMMPYVRMVGYQPSR
jgi:sigma-E factor negative regulatory protein RseA